MLNIHGETVKPENESGPQAKAQTQKCSCCVSDGNRLLAFCDSLAAAALVPIKYFLPLRRIFDVGLHPAAMLTSIKGRQLVSSVLCLAGRLRMLSV